MAIAIADSGAAHTIWHGNPGPITSSAIDTSGSQLIILSLACDISSGTIAVSDSKSNSWSVKITHDSAGFARTQIWMCVPTTVGSGHTFTVTNANFCRAQVTAYTGYGGTPTLDQSSAGSGSTSAQPGSITPSTNNQLIVCASGADGSIGGVASIDSSFSIIDQGPEIGSDCYGLSAAYLVQTTATAENPTTTWTVASACNACILSFDDFGASSVSLIAAAATAAAGAFGLSGDVPLAAASATGNVSVLSGDLPDLVVAAATGTAADFTSSPDLALTGAQAVGVAAPIFNTDFTLDTAAATGAVADFATPAAGFALNAVAAIGATAVFQSNQTVLLGAVGTASVAAFDFPNLQPAFTGVAATGAAADFMLPVVDNYVLNAATGYYALNGIAAGLQVTQGPPPAFEPIWTWDMGADSGLQFISYNITNAQMLVQYLTGFAQVYDNVSSIAAQRIVSQINAGVPTAQALSGLAV